MQVDFFNYALLLMSDILNWLMNLDAKKKMPTSAMCRFHCDTNSIRIVSSGQTDYLFLSFIACITYSVHPLILAWCKNSKKYMPVKQDDLERGCPKGTCQFDMIRIFLKKIYSNFLALGCHKISFYWRLLQRPKTAYNCNILRMGEDNIFWSCFEQNMLYL